MFKYVIIANDYPESLALAQKLKIILTDREMQEDIIAPEYVFVIGGDGTLLRAVNEFQDILDEVCLIVVKSGSLGFYANYDEKTVTQAIDDIINDTAHIQQLPLLEVKFNNNQIRYALNEVKIVDHVKTIRTDIYINDELLEYFRGSGLVFATSTGSTGYMRAIGGAIILSNKHKLWEMKEIAPVANSTFSTITAPLILDDSQSVILEGELIDKQIIIDTYEYEANNNLVEIKFSDKTLNLIYNHRQNQSTTAKLQTLFAYCNNVNKRGDR
ncbi:inorganic polyphosphate/ATP-NAD kinase [Spiroplasma syrphidicola EA-1]|uniref:Inorganic polyphosphate/ATP-NAD kinase n=1 Tax=Spiroplasma syrphidicola EA-1 TaxID=1276229 RepID=R4U4M3_9MOLU|nr:NAD(+)/NADH kinase [Spiroplasma syrphidicola]AGM26432.1 inorganic polyphosphate/ATP-NAD kinase [Spiroplasma syrphidicola EA-1]